MILVVGLGNPGPRYVGTRHNVGFLVVDSLVERAGGSFRARFDGELSQIDCRRVRICVLKPQTYMNLSGHSVQTAAAFFKIEPHDILVVHDELDLALGDLRLKRGGGDAGHNGLRSITEQLGTGDYMRLRVGIGRPIGEYTGTMADYVLQGFPSIDRPVLDEVTVRANEAIGQVIAAGLSPAMNVVNRKPKP